MTRRFDSMNGVGGPGADTCRLVAAFIRDEQVARLTCQPDGRLEVDWCGGVRAFGPEERADCARAMLDCCRDGAAGKPLIWINRSRLLRMLQRTPVSSKSIDPSLRLTRLLVIDSDRPMARRLRLQLQRFGYDASYACSAYHAARMGKCFDVVISDVGLPEFRDCQLLHQLHTEVGLLGISLNHQLAPEDEREFYTKPVSAAELHAAIQHLAYPASPVATAS